MKALFILFSLMTLVYTGQAQEDKRIVINPAKHNEDELLKKIFRYPQFVAGKAFFKNGFITESKFNYNYLTNRIHFISPAGDTLELTQGEDFKKVAIQADTFYYYNKEFVQQITYEPQYNLMMKTALRYNGSERKGAYEGYSATTSVSSLSLWSSDGVPVKLHSDENIIFTFRQYYYLSGKFGTLYPATKKGFYELFPKHQKQLKSFLDKNKIDLDKKEDIEKMLRFARSLE